MFDPKAARALKAGEHLVIEGAPGLRLEAAQSTRTWTARYRSPVDGRMRQIKLGRWPAMGLPAALVAWQSVKDRRDAGADPALEKKAARVPVAVYTVRHACDDFLRAYKGTVAPKTYLEASKLLAGPAVQKIEKRAASSITRADAFDCIESMSATPVNAGNLRRVLGAVWDRALDAGRLPPDCPNWWRLILRGKLRSKGKIIGGEHQGVVKRALSEAELRQLLPFLRQFPTDIADALTLMLWTCCRGAEIVAMRAEEIDGDWWTIPREKLKMRRIDSVTDLRVPLVGKALEIVRRRTAERPSGYLFPSRSKSGHIEQKALGVAVWTHRPDCESRPEWVRPRLPVADFSPHDLRRTGRTMLASMGCPSEVAEAVLGHMQGGIVGVYNMHQYDAERREWLTRLATRLESLAS